MIVAGLHTEPHSTVEAVALKIAATLGGQNASSAKLTWLRSGHSAFREYLARGRWEVKTDTRTKIILGGILASAGLGELSPSTLLGALMNRGNF